MRRGFLWTGLIGEEFKPQKGLETQIAARAGISKLISCRSWATSEEMNSIINQKFSSPEGARHWAQIVAFAPFVFQAARCLRNFGILEAVNCASGASVPDLKLKSGLSDYSLSVLLDAGVSCALIYKQEANYFISPAGVHIANDALTNVNMNFTNDVCYQGLASLEESLRNERPEGLRVFGEWQTIYENLTQLPPTALKSWLQFDHYFSDDALPKVVPIFLKDSPRRILDVGGNTGKFAVACAAYDKNVLITMLDHPAQLEMAGKFIHEKGFADRIERLPMNLLDHSLPFPKGYDAIWMSQFLDCFSKADILELFKRTHAAMSDDARFFIMESFVDRQRYEAGRFCLDMTSLYFTCLANGNSRMYRASDFLELLEQAGFKVETELDNIRLSQTILKCRRA